MVHGGGVQCNYNRHHVGRGRGSITLIRFAQILHICPEDIICIVYTVYIVIICAPMDFGAWKFNTKSVQGVLYM